jgi:hypothetical protein
MRCQNCGHDTTAYDPYEIINELLHYGPMTGWNRELGDRARACLRNNPMTRIADLPPGGFDTMMRLPVTDIYMQRLGFDELRAPIWTTKDGHVQFMEILKRAERMYLPLPREEKDWLRKALSLCNDRLPTLRYLLRR